MRYTLQFSTWRATGMKPLSTSKETIKFGKSRLLYFGATPTMEALPRSLESRSEYNVEYRLVTPDGSPCWISTLGRATFDSETGLCAGKARNGGSGQRRLCRRSAGEFGAASVACQPNWKNNTNMRAALPKFAAPDFVRWLRASLRTSKSGKSRIWRSIR
jgi:PAS fold